MKKKYLVISCLVPAKIFKVEEDTTIKEIIEIMNEETLEELGGESFFGREEDECDENYDGNYHTFHIIDFQNDYVQLELNFNDFKDTYNMKVSELDNNWDFFGN